MPVESQHLQNLTEAEIQAIITSISCERLSSYMKSTNSEAEALMLYEYNARLSKVLYELIGGFEVALRNAVAHLIMEHFNRDDWYRARAFTNNLKMERRKNLKEVRKRLKSQGQKECGGRVIAGLTFHFWVSMHENKYRDHIWSKYLYKAWPVGENIKAVHKDLLKVRDLRNRIAHHEPIFLEKWYDRESIVWNRFGQLSPEKCSWYSNRIKGELENVSRKINCFQA